MSAATVTHERFIHAVRDAAVSVSALSGDGLARVQNAKLVYGRGARGLRGVTQYGAWQNGSTDELIEICALGEESWIQLAGTTVHELAHAATGHGHGHGKAWKEACGVLGLRRVMAAGTNYRLANFSPALRLALAGLAKPDDGEPTAAGLLALAQRPCSAGVGVRGGTSRGAGSGSRMRKWQCEHGQIVRAATDDLQADCRQCGTAFVLV